MCHSRVATARWGQVLRHSHSGMRWEQMCAVATSCQCELTTGESLTSLGKQQTLISNLEAPSGKAASGCLRLQQ